MALSGEQVAQVLYQAGFRGQDLVNMTAIAGRESGFQPDAHRTDQPKSALSGDLGLFQINYVNWPTVSSALGLTSKTQLFDPLTNARAALVLFQASGYDPWTAGSGGWTAGGDPMYGTNVSAAQGYVDNAAAQGILGQDYGGGGGGGSAPQSGTLGTTPDGNGPTVIPPDAKIYAVEGVGIVATFDVGGVILSYGIDWWSGNVQWDKSKEVKISRAGFEALGVVPAGNATELSPIVAVHGTFTNFWDRTLNQIIGVNNPARNDAGVLGVIAQFAARPDMTDAELQNLLSGTDWYQSRTESELAWNSLSEAERKKRRDDMSARMVQTYFEFAGEQVDVNDPRIANYIEQVASGKMGYGAFTDVVKAYAIDTPESPWARTVRTEEETQKQRPIDIENTSQRVRDLSRRWGIQWDDQTIKKWAKGIVEKDFSDEDLISQLQGEANAIYTWKDPNTETATAAAPWLDTFKRTFEADADVFTSEVARALTSGQTVWDFEQDLKKSDRWLTTKNGQQSVTESIAAVGKKMGFES